MFGMPQMSEEVYPESMIILLDSKGGQIDPNIIADNPDPVDKEN